MANDYARTVADKLIEQLKEGTAPWQKPWDATGIRSMPYNPTSGNDYKGMNAVWLMAQGQADSRWMTYKQAAGVGAQVRKGEKGTQVQYWKFEDRVPVKDASGKPVRDGEGKPITSTVKLERPRVFTATVFNASQIDGLPPPEQRPQPNEWEREQRAEAILAGSKADIRHQPGDRAYYSPALDHVVLPDRSQFPDSADYYGTALHELGHWTGHKSRLDRDLAHPFGSEGYAREELRAEISSLMMGDQLGIPHKPDRHAAYVGSWIKALENDPREIFRAAADAEKITRMLHGFEQQQAQTIDQPGQGPLAEPIERTVFDAFADRSHYVGHGGGELIDALKAKGLTTVASVVGDSPDYPTMFNTAIERLSPVYGIAPDFDGHTNAYYERKSLAADFAARGDGLLRGTIENPADRFWRENEQLAPAGKAIGLNHFELALGQAFEAGMTLDDATAHAMPRVPSGLLDEAAFAVPQGEFKQGTWAQLSRQIIGPNRDDTSAASNLFDLRGDRPVMPNPPPLLGEAPTVSDQTQLITTPILTDPSEVAMKTSPEPVYLAVSFAEKNEAKALGAKWDREAKSWFAPAGADLAPLERWLPNNQPTVATGDIDPRQEFKDALKEAGLIVEGLPQMDGQLVRVKVDGDKGKERSGTYVGHSDGRPAGYINNFRTGYEGPWKASGAKAKALTAQERARMAAEAAANRAQRERERDATHESVAHAIEAHWMSAAPASADHPYLAKKGVEAYGVRVDQTGKLALPPGAAPEDQQEFSRPGSLLVPLRDTDERLWAVQAIDGSGFKSLPKGGRYSGLFHAIGDMGGDGALIVAEGYSTSAELHRETGLPVAVAFSSNNIEAVATGLRERHPDRPIIVAGDNDHRKPLELDAQGRPKPNVGREKAEAAAEAVGGYAMLPAFEQGDKGTDWNDLRADKGQGIFSAQVRAGLAAAQRHQLARESGAARVTLAADQQQLDRQQTRERPAIRVDEGLPPPKRARSR